LFQGVARDRRAPRFVNGAGGFDRRSIIDNTAARTKAARVFDLPVVNYKMSGDEITSSLNPNSGFDFSVSRFVPALADRQVSDRAI
jgi:hypothetical protein